jgi:DNA topoisomerase-1
MSNNLVIVESPAKGKTIEKYLGKDFSVLASYGHVRDLVPKEGAVDPASGFAMKYQVIDKNERHVDNIARALKKADTLYLATDPDREGEAISWHLYEILRERKLLEDKKVYRVVFHEITKRAVQEAIDHPRDLSHDLVDAQQARRALDYLVGFNLSPLLWKKIRRGLSAGRVQSPALRMIVEREQEIEKFVSQEYWSLAANVSKQNQPFSARLYQYDGKRVEQFDFTNEEQAEAARAALSGSANGELKVSKVDKKQRKRNPAAPFTTSTLQQEASRKLGFSTQRTMRTAQQLYEGINLGSGPVGLITYMRTDSVTLAADAIAEIRQVIEQRYGAEQVPETPRVFKTKSKNAQEAHEAIRPTASARIPDEVKGHLTQDQFRLYDLIWKRTVACQMVHATLDTVAADLSAGNDHLFRATGSSIRNAGFMAVYQEGIDDRKKDDDDQKLLPHLEQGEIIQLLEVEAEQHFTEPPPRFTEASLVKALEEYGIGRPSTYASIISTLTNREYVELESRRFHPTDVGKIVNSFLTNHFNRYVDYDFTAHLEDDLDAISRGEKDWVPVLDDFWKPFIDQIEHAETNVSRLEAVQARELGIDPRSGKPVTVRMGRYGPMVQIGTKDDEEKPLFAGLSPGQKMDLITLEEALKLFELPRHLGETEEGDEVSAGVGRFGPYVKYGRKYVSIPQGEDPHTITLERALELIEEKKPRVLGLSDDGEQMTVGAGRFGPYVQYGDKFVSIPKNEDPATLTAERAKELIAEKKIADAKRVLKKFEGSEIIVWKGRWGRPCVKLGKVEAPLAKETDLDALTLEECQKMIESVPGKKKAAKKKTVKKKAAKKKAAKKKTVKKKAVKKKAAKKQVG